MGIHQSPRKPLTSRVCSIASCPLTPIIHSYAQAISFLTLYTINAAHPIPPIPSVDKVSPTVGDSIAKLATLSTDVKARMSEGPQLDPPKDTPFTAEELKFYDGQVEGEKIYVAIKGIVFDGKSDGWRGATDRRVAEG